jgi:hypothetical protein
MAGFDTQFFHDDPDAGDFALVDDGILGDEPSANGNPEEEADLWAGTQGKLKMARPESVHYAKRAKKVDVKRLKDNIWKGLRIQEKISGTDEMEVSNRGGLFDVWADLSRFSADGGRAHQV